MNEIIMAENVKKLLAPFLEKGFVFEYLYQKGGDSSCVYICRFKKGQKHTDKIRQKQETTRDITR